MTDIKQRYDGMFIVIDLDSDEVLEMFETEEAAKSAADTAQAAIIPEAVTPSFAVYRLERVP